MRRGAGSNTKKETYGVSVVITLSASMGATDPSMSTPYPEMERKWSCFLSNRTLRNVEAIEKHLQRCVDFLRDQRSKSFWSYTAPSDRV